jgi:hypothetical protein
LALNIIEFEFWTLLCVLKINCWYSLKAGQFGDRIPVVAKYSSPLQTFTKAHRSFFKIVAGNFFPGKSAWAWRWPQTLPLASRLKKVYNYITVPPVRLRNSPHAYSVYGTDILFSSIIWSWNHEFVKNWIIFISLLISKHFICICTVRTGPT